VSFASSIIGGFLLLQLLLVRFLTAADASRVWVVGRELHIGCWFRDRFGIPCPACGLTRSTILFLYGHFDQAFRLNAAGPVLAGGLLIFSGLMLHSSIFPNVAKSKTTPVLVVAFGWLFALVMVVQWLIKLPR
jgi:Protein of unknown function (DUF2752)